jgi:hypothetical protein
MAQTVFSTDFEAGLPAEFSGAGAVTGTEGYSAFGFGDSYLRNATAGNPASPTVLSLGGLPSHTDVEISFDLAIIDSWDGSTDAFAPDLLNVTVNGLSVFSDTFDNFAAGDQTYLGPATALRVLNLAQNGDWPDSAYPISITLPHTGDSLDLEWFASGAGWQGGGLDESWAIDNLRVTVRERQECLMPERRRSCW